MEDKRQEYIDYFTHMQEEDKRIPLGEMVWDDISLCIEKILNT